MNNYDENIELTFDNNKIEVVFTIKNNRYSLCKDDIVWFLKYPYKIIEKSKQSDKYLKYQNHEINSLLLALMGLNHVVNYNQLNFSDPFYHAEEPFRSNMLFKSLPYLKMNKGTSDSFVKEIIKHATLLSPKGLPTNVNQNFYIRKKSSDDELYIAISFSNDNVSFIKIEDNSCILENDNSKFADVVKILSNIKTTYSKFYLESIFLKSSNNECFFYYTQCEPFLIDFNHEVFNSIKKNIISSITQFV